MITRSRKIICDSAVALFLLFLFSGCAQTHANIKEGQSVEKSGGAIIQAITASSDGIQVGVLTDKPLSYTYYKTSDPPKVVIDIAQTEPGTLEKPIEFTDGNIKRIEVTKHDFSGGFLSRVEIILNKDEDSFTVATDPVDKGKLLISFTKTEDVVNPGSAALGEVNPASTDASQNPASPAGTEVKEAALSVNETTDSRQIQAENKVDQTSQETVPAEQKVEKQSEAAAPQTSEPKLLRAVSANDEGIVISISGGVENYNAFKLTKPDRIVLDLPGVKSGIASKTITLGRFSVGQVRQGFYPDKIRIVFDAEKGTLPPYQVLKTDDGLKVVFTAAAVAPVESARKEAAKEPEKQAVKERVTATRKTSAIEAIDFKVVDDSSRIAIKVSGDCSAADPLKVSGGLSLIIKNCQIPGKLQRMIDTSAFPSVVRMITPYQVKMKRGSDARILVKLRQATSSVLRKDGDTLYWDIRNPENNKPDEMLSAQPNLSPERKIRPAAPPAEAGEGVARTVKTAAASDMQLASAPKYGEKKVYTGRRVSLEFSDADIRKILQLIAEVSNLNFIIGDDISGTISIKLINVPWDQALDVILGSKGLEKRQDGNIMYIKPKGKFKTEEQEENEAKRERERRMELKTRVFEVSFADIGDIAKQFDKLKSERGTIAQDDRTNRVIVTDIENRLEKMQNLLKALDMPEKQVMIEARIVEASSTFTRDLGVQWGIHYRDGSASFLGINRLDMGLGGIVTPPPTSGTAGVTSSGAATGISFGKLTSSVQLDLRLSAAATIGQVKVISSPKVITLNNKAAKISQGQSIPYQTTSAEGTKTEFVEAALTLEVTPHIAADGTISMKIKATNNSAGQPVAGSSAPPINKKEATTEVQVMNGETTVIGGIYQDSDQESDTGVPYLQNIPLLGWLFKSNSKTKTKTELLIFITPKIVS